MFNKVAGDDIEKELEGDFVMTMSTSIYSTEIDVSCLYSAGVLFVHL